MLKINSWQYCLKKGCSISSPCQNMAPFQSCSLYAKKVRVYKLKCNWKITGKDFTFYRLIYKLLLSGMYILKTFLWEKERMWRLICNKITLEITRTAIYLQDRSPDWQLSVWTQNLTIISELKCSCGLNHQLSHDCHNSSDGSDGITVNCSLC